LQIIAIKFYRGILKMEYTLLLKMVLMVISTAVITSFSAVGVSVYYGFKVYYLVKSKEVKKKKPRK